MILRSSANGQIFVCNQCQKIHLEFGNFSYDFISESKLINFWGYLKQLNGLHYESLNESSAYRRKIMVPIPDTGLKILFTSGELDEIRNLIQNFLELNRKELISITKIEVDLRTLTPKHLN